MKVVILAAGEGKRMRPLTETIPKPMVRVLGRTLLEYQLDALPDNITEVVVVIGYKGEEIRKFLGDTWQGKPVHYAIQQQIGGNAQALDLCRPFLKDEPLFLVMYADDIHGKEGVEACVKKNKPCYLVDTVEDPRKFGVIELDDTGCITCIEEKPKQPKSQLVSVGAFTLNNDIFHYTSPLRNGEEYITDRVTAMIADGHIFHTVRSSGWISVGYPEDVAKAEQILNGMRV